MAPGGPSGGFADPSPDASALPPHAVPNAEDGAPEPARHILRRRTVERFLSRPDDPGGAMPAAIREVVGGPVMWSEQPVRENQFSPEQKSLVLEAAREIRKLYLDAGGRIPPSMSHDDALGLMPDNTFSFAYQSEEWAAARAVNAGMPFSGRDDLPAWEQLRQELAEAYYTVITWIDYVKGGLLDASAVYEAESDQEGLEGE